MSLFKGELTHERIIKTLGGRFAHDVAVNTILSGRDNVRPVRANSHNLREEIRVDHS